MLGKVAFAAFVLAATPIASRASDPVPPRGPDRAHPNAARINQANSRVIHAGPGAPLSGSVHAPTAKKKE